MNRYRCPLCSKHTTHYWGTPKPCAYCIKCEECGQNAVKNDNLYNRETGEGSLSLEDRIWKVNQNNYKFICLDHRKEDKYQGDDWWWSK